MAEQQPVKKNRYCWVIFIVCCFAGLCGVGLISNTYGLFMGPIAVDLGFQTSQVSLIMTIASWITVAFYFLGGKAFAKWGPRAVSTVSGFIIAACMLLYASGTQIWHFYLTAALCGAMGAFAALNVVPILINNWFIKHRALVTGIAYMMTGIGGALYNPLFASIIVAHDWRYGYRVAFVIALIYPVLALILLRNKPAEMGLKPYGIEESEEMKDIKDQVEIKEFPGIPKKYAYKSAALWLALITIMFNGFCTGFNQHWVNAGVTYGFDLVSASFLATAAMLASAAFKIIGGALNDSKLGPRNTFVLFSIIGTISMIIMMIQHTHPSLGVIALCAVIYGTTVSLTTMQGPVICREIFGMRDYGLLYPIVFMGMSLGTGLTYSLNAFMLEAVGSYMGSYIFNAACNVIALIFVCITFAAGKKARAKYWREVGEAI